MAGRHSKRRWTHAQAPEQRGPHLLGITDAHTHVEHLVCHDSVAAQRHAGHYVALCGMTVLAASLTDPGRGRCRECTR